MYVCWIYSGSERRIRFICLGLVQRQSHSGDRLTLFFCGFTLSTLIHFPGSYSCQLETVIPQCGYCHLQQQFITVKILQYCAVEKMNITVLYCQLFGRHYTVILQFLHYSQLTTYYNSRLYQLYLILTLT